MWRGRKEGKERRRGRERGGGGRGEVKGGGGRGDKANILLSSERRKQHLHSPPPSPFSLRSMWGTLSTCCSEQ